MNQMHTVTNCIKKININKYSYDSVEVSQNWLSKSSLYIVTVPYPSDAYTVPDAKSYTY